MDAFLLYKVLTIHQLILHLPILAMARRHGAACDVRGGAIGASVRRAVAEPAGRVVSLADAGGRTWWFCDGFNVVGFIGWFLKPGDPKVMAS